MKKPTVVKFQEPFSPVHDAEQPVSTRMRYSQLLRSVTGNSMISGRPSDTAAQEPLRRVFDSSAAPCKPAMKHSEPKAAADEYPVVQDLPAQCPAAKMQPNPATGVAFQTKGGAALSSALGAMEIPPDCPPAPAPMTGRATAAAAAMQQAQTLQQSNWGAEVPNPLAIPDMPLMPVSYSSSTTAGSSTVAGSISNPVGAVTSSLTPCQAAAPLGQDADSQHLNPLQQVQPNSLNNTPISVRESASSHYDSPMSSEDAPHVTVQLTPRDSLEKMRYISASNREIADDVGKAVDQDKQQATQHWQQVAAEEAKAAAAAAAAAVEPPASCNMDIDDKDSGAAIIPPGHQDPLPTFWQQFSFRAVIAGLIVGCVFVLLTMRLALVTGIAQNLQIVVAGGCWLLLRAYTGLLGRDMQCIRVLTAQEVAVAASTALAVASSAASGSYGTVLLAIQEPVAQRIGSNISGNLPTLVWGLGYWKLLAYQLVVGLSGALLMLSFRKLLFARPSFTFATGAAAGQLISTLHTPAMSYHGHKQMHRFAQWSAISFLFSGYQWIFNNPACNGFLRFPTFGLQALEYTWNFDFQLPFVGLGIIAPISVAWSLVVGGVLSWGLVWPVLSSKEGSWFPENLASNDIRGAYGYYLVAAMAFLLADGAYHIGKGVLGFVLTRNAAQNAETASELQTPDATGDSKAAAVVPDEELGPGLRRKRGRRRNWRREALHILETDTLSDASSLQFGMAAMERALRQHIFMADGAVSWVGVAGFVLMMGAAVAALPNLFGFSTAIAAGGASKTTAAAASGLMYYHVLVAAILAAIVALANVRGAGVTNIDLANAYAKLGILIFSAWAGSGVGSAGAGLICGGLLCGVATSAVNAMYAWRAGFMVMANPTAIFISHVIGLTFGCIATPLAWLLFGSAMTLHGTTAGSLFASDGFFASPVAAVYRATAVVAGAGPEALPLYALWVGLGAAIVAFILNGVRDVLPQRVKGLVPIPAAVGVVCLSGAWVAVDLAVGAIVRIMWRLRYARSADAYALVVGCALIAGEGLWGLGKALLAAFDQQSPICMSFSVAPRP